MKSSPTPVALSPIGDRAPLVEQPGAVSASAIIWRLYTAIKEEEDVTRTLKLNREEARIICQKLMPAIRDTRKRIAVITFYKARQRLLGRCWGRLPPS